MLTIVFPNDFRQSIFACVRFLSSTIIHEGNGADVSLSFGFSGLPNLSLPFIKHIASQKGEAKF